MKVYSLFFASVLSLCGVAFSPLRAETFVGTWNLDGDLAIFDASPVSGVTVSDLVNLDPVLEGGTMETSARTLEINRAGADARGANAWAFVNDGGSSQSYFLGFTVTNKTGKELTVDSVSLSQTKGDLLAFEVVSDEAGNALTKAESVTPARGEVDNVLLAPFPIENGKSATFWLDFNSPKVDSVHSVDLIRVKGTVGG